MASEQPKTIESLPPELLTEIFSHLTCAPPSETRLHDQPKSHMLADREATLKVVSLVSKRWRATALPVLFRHVVWALDRWDLLLVEPGQDVDPVDGLPLLRFLRDHGLGRHVFSLTMIVSNSLHGLMRLNEPGLEDSAHGSERSASSHRESKKAQMLLGGSRYPHIANRAATYSEDNNWLWKTLFDLMDPKRFTMIASPHMLTSLLSRMLFLGDAWCFNRDDLHILSLSRESPTKTPPTPSLASAAKPNSGSSSTTSASTSTSTSTEPVASSSSSKCPATPASRPCELFTIRPWTHLLLNEGSSTRVYKTYEFFLKRPPSILGALLGCEEAPNNTPLIPPTLKSMSYVAIFPLSYHFNTLVAFLPRIDHLFVQLVPRNSILQDREEMRNVDPSDLWMERNSCYGLIMRELLTSDMADKDDDAPGSNWRHLRTFTSGDAADEEAWDMAVHYVRTSRSGWRVEGNGIFVRGPPKPAPQAAWPPSEDGSNHNSNDSDNLGLGEDGDGEDEYGNGGIEILSVPPQSFSPW
ncbi:hypothetical protein QBC46DRAFT_419216 [Diplogelasinospora grovesii]|uniref:F-box domain-containing protein n=1 Tax=Diplogelasinospora grovesii TaxID=303347 RepID=A0AAN6S1F1_9PEZI|nr:hypothetical protein QBC46DRAFT_419216 [Diplogelasinospora grovesii]